jgi:hypothetical protein
MVCIPIVMVSAFLLVMIPVLEKLDARPVFMVRTGAGAAPSQMVPATDE